MRPIARPERKSRNAIFPDIPWRGSRPSEEEGKRENKRERDFYHGSILVLRHRLSIFHFPLDPRQSFALGTRPSYFLPLPPAGGTYLTTVICISILLKRKYLIKLAGNVVSRRRRGRMPDPPYRNFASQFILSSRRIPRNLEYPSRMNDSSAPRIPPPPPFFLSFFKLEIYIYIYLSRGKKNVGWNLIATFDTDLTDVRTRPQRRGSVNIGIRRRGGVGVKR